MILIRLLLLAFAFLVQPAFAEEPMDPEKAYRFSVRAIDANTVEARWQIASDYYMYRQKIRFTAEPATVKLGEGAFPAGKVKQDEFFGEVETYRGDIRIQIPVEAGGAESFTLKAMSQGCWDKGICFPPLSQQAKVSLVEGGTSTPAMSEAPAMTPAAAPLVPGEEEGDESSRIARVL